MLSLVSAAVWHALLVCYLFGLIFLFEDLVSASTHHCPPTTELMGIPAASLLPVEVRTHAHHAHFLPYRKLQYAVCPSLLVRYGTAGSGTAPLPYRAQGRERPEAVCGTR